MAFVILEARMGKLPIQPKVDRETYFRFKSLAHSHGVSVEKALEELMRDALERAGIQMHQRPMEPRTQAK